MTRIDQAIIARLKKGKETFEILVDCEKALAFREGKVNDLSDVLATREIYTDVRHLKRAQEQALLAAFQTGDVDVIAKEIIRKGDIQLTTEHREKLRAAKHKQIVEFIHKNTVDPKTGLPHPQQRIENALGELKIKVDEFKSAEIQVQEIIPRLRPLLALKLETRTLDIIVPPAFSGKTSAAVKRFGTMVKEEWQRDGSLKMIVDVPAGVQEELESELNKLSHAQITFTIISKR